MDAVTIEGLVVVGKCAVLVVVVLCVLGIAIWYATRPIKKG